MLFEMIRIIPRRLIWWLEVKKKPPKTNLDFSLPVQPAIRAGWMKSPYPHFSPGRQSHSHTLSLRRTFKRSWIKRIQLRIRNRLPWNSQTRLTQVEDHIAHKELQLQSLEIWKMCISSSSTQNTQKMFQLDSPLCLLDPPSISPTPPAFSSQPQPRVSKVLVRSDIHRDWTICRPTINIEHLFLSLLTPFLGLLGICVSIIYVSSFPAVENNDFYWIVSLFVCFFVSTSLFVGRIECSWAVDLSTSVVESATRATSDDSMLMKLRESDNSHWPCWWWGLCWCWCWWQQMNDLTPQQQILPTQALGEDLSAPVLDSQYITHLKNSPRFKL